MVVAYHTGEGKAICISDWYGEAGAYCGKKWLDLHQYYHYQHNRGSKNKI